MTSRRTMRMYATRTASPSTAAANKPRRNVRVVTVSTVVTRLGPAPLGRSCSRPSETPNTPLLPWRPHGREHCAGESRRASPRLPHRDLPDQLRRPPARGQLHADHLVQALLLLHVPRHRAGVAGYRRRRRARRDLAPPPPGVDGRDPHVEPPPGRGQRGDRLPDRGGG